MSGDPFEMSGDPFEMSGDPFDPSLGGGEDPPLSIINTHTK